jgi:Alkylmercury lyase
VPVRIVVEPGTIECVEPIETLVVARRGGEAPAHEACCDFTVFACSPEHADELLARTSDTSILDLSTALTVSEALFAG